jgi:hypothetical protein
MPGQAGKYRGRLASSGQGNPPYYERPHLVLDVLMPLLLTLARLRWEIREPLIS